MEYLYLIAPVPLGGDTETWTALSYPFIFYPHPSEIVHSGYPPGLFPLLGFFVLLGGGPLVGPRIYLGFAIVMLGLSTYVVGRSLFHFRISALLVEALLFATVPSTGCSSLGAIPPSWHSFSQISHSPSVYVSSAGGGRCTYSSFGWRSARPS